VEDKDMQVIKAAILGLALLPVALIAQPAAMPMPAEATAPTESGAIPLYGAETPGSTDSETWSKMGPALMVRNVTRPTLTPVLPKRGKANGAAVIIAPGGAFMGLAMQHEGWDVARALADRGITAFVLKYRLIETPRDNAEGMRFMGMMMMKEVASPMDGPLLRQSKAPEDARAALAMVRAGAAKWGIDPRRVGIIGFSAGAMTARRAALDPDASARPDFLGYIYGPQDAEPVPADAPPLFNAIALDDNLFANKGFPIAQAWLSAKRPVEIHAYQKGGHGFGLGAPGTSNTLLIDEFTAWLSMQGFLAQPKTK
jgi:dienelactone hydrolase